MCLILIGYGYWRHLQRYVTTNDAYVNANVVNIAAQVSGPVAFLGVKNNQFVHKGQLLFTIDPAPFQITVNKAKAQLLLSKQNEAASNAAVQAAEAKVSQAQAQLEVQKQNVPRILTLASEGKAAKADGVVAQGKLDSAKAELVAASSELIEAKQNLGDTGNANAQIQTASSNLATAQLDLQHTKIYAPADGFLANFDIRPGTMITAGQQIFALIESKRWWVTANLKETALKYLQPGQKATIQLDIYPHITFQGYVQSLSFASGAVFSLLPPENATGNWVKVTQRFPVKIVFIHPNPQYPLRVGASGTVSIDTKSYISGKK
jgi:membrane fusion protein (multidrug efflux system)